MPFQTHKTFVLLQTQTKIFLMKSGAFWPCIDSNVTEKFKAKKRSKDIVK